MTSLQFKNCGWPSWVSPIDLQLGQRLTNLAQILQKKGTTTTRQWTSDHVNKTSIGPKFKMVAGQPRIPILHHDRFCATQSDHATYKGYHLVEELCE